VTIVAAIVWGCLVGLSYWHWVRVSKRLNQPLELPSRIGILLLPVWTVRAWLTVSWLPRRRLRRHIKELRTLEKQASPDARPEILDRLRTEIERLETLASRKNIHDD
jgi:hypothetical protein